MSSSWASFGHAHRSACRERQRDPEKGDLGVARRADQPAIGFLIESGTSALAERKWSRVLT
jgi:hypothetical protein